MRTVEILLLLGVLVSAIISLTRLRLRSVILPAVLATSGCLLIAHAFADGLRQQMILVYLGLLLLSLKYVSERLRKNSGNPDRKPRTQRVIATSFLILSAILLYLLPVHKMPAPDGPYKIGTETHELTDAGRSENYGPDPDIARRIRFQIWYPADTNNGGERTRWMTDGRAATKGVPKMYGFPDFAMHHTALTWSNSYRDVAISSEEISYPVVIISHGWTGFMNVHSDIAEMLASHGYIVVSINHTYGAAVTVFEDGEVVFFDPAALPERDAVDDYDKYSHALVNTFALDDLLVLEFLNSYNDSNGALNGKIDMSRIGVLGHSTGGGGVVQLAIEDSRIGALFGMDAWVEPIDQMILDQGLRVPACFLRSGRWETGINNRFLRRLIGNSSQEPAAYQINGSNHMDFSMLYMFRPITTLFGISGSLDIMETSAILRDYVLTFFNRTLKGDSRDWRELEFQYKFVSRVTEYKTP